MWSNVIDYQILEMLNTIEPITKTKLLSIKDKIDCFEYEIEDSIDRLIQTKQIEESNGFYYKRERIRIRMRC